MKAHSEHELSVARVLVARCTLCAHSEPKHCSRKNWQPPGSTWLIYQAHDMCALQFLFFWTIFSSYNTEHFLFVFDDFAAYYIEQVYYVRPVSHRGRRPFLIFELTTTRIIAFINLAFLKYYYFSSNICSAITIHPKLTICHFLRP